MANERLVHLQALRGLAASLVVVSHCMSARGTYLDRVWISGYLGVCIFFVLSGFIIYRTASRSFGEPHAMRQFIGKRVLRIFPTYWIATALFVALTPHGVSFVDVLSSIVLLPHPIGDGMGPILAQGWTLQYEVMFYAVFAVGLLLPRVGGVVLIAAILAGLVYVGHFNRFNVPDAHLALAAYWARPIILLFVVGISIGIIADRVRMRIPYAFPLLLALLGVWLAYSLTSPLSEDDHLWFPQVLVIWGLAVLFVLVGVFGANRNSRFEPVAEAFGDASYSVYLFHTFVLSALIRLHVNAYPGLYAVSCVVGANLFGYLLYRLVETPILRHGRQLLRRIG